MRIMPPKGARPSHAPPAWPFLFPDNNTMSATNDSSQTGEPLPGSKRVYLQGTIHPNIQVPMREISVSPTKTYLGAIEPNEPVRVYDCSGPWGDPDFKGNVEQGLPALRAEWIRARGDVE